MPYRKIADRFVDLHGFELSGASAWHCVQRVAEAGCDEYETIGEQIREAAVVHVDETVLSLDGEQGWLWTFKIEEAVLYHIIPSRRSEVLEAMLGVYVNNQTDDAHERVRAAYGENYDRLVEIKTEWDPENLFRMNQNIELGHRGSIGEIFSEFQTSRPGS